MNKSNNRRNLLRDAPLSLCTLVASADTARLVGGDGGEGEEKNLQKNT